jgi:uncharacterized peroxidase-related enzyme
MSFIRTTAPDEAVGDVAAMYLRQQSAWGYVPNYAKVFSHRPEVLARWAQLLAEIRRPMDSRRFELATFAAAHELRNSACTLAHGNKLREFLSDEDIAALAAGRGVATLTRAEQAMLRFARQLARDASKVTTSQISELKALGFTDADVFDIAAVAAGRAFFAKLLDALGVEPDSPFQALDTALLQALTVGRPIDTRPCVTMPANTGAPV